MQFFNSVIVGIASTLLFTTASAAPTPQFFNFLKPLLGSLLGSATSSQSSPNPIADQYPLSITGTINATIAVIPIPYSLARSIIPSQWGILKNAYQSLLPGFPTDKYPVSSILHQSIEKQVLTNTVQLFIRGGLDHDTGISGLGITIPDFQVSHLLPCHFFKL